MKELAQRSQFNFILFIWANVCYMHNVLPTPTTKPTLKITQDMYDMLTWLTNTPLPAASLCTFCADLSKVLQSRQCCYNAIYGIWIFHADVLSHKRKIQPTHPWRSSTSRHRSATHSHISEYVLGNFYVLFLWLLYATVLNIYDEAYTFPLILGSSSYIYCWCLTCQEYVHMYTFGDPA